MGSDDVRRRLRQHVSSVSTVRRRVSTLAYSTAMSLDEFANRIDEILVEELEREVPPWISPEGETDD